MSNLKIIKSMKFLLIPFCLFFVLQCSNSRNNPVIVNMTFIYPDYLNETGVIFHYDDFIKDDETEPHTGLHYFVSIDEGWRKIYKPEYVKNNPEKYYNEWVKSFGDYKLSNKNMFLLFYTRGSSVRAPLESATFSDENGSYKLEIVEFIPSKKMFSSDWQPIIYLMEVPKFNGKLNLILKKHNEYDDSINNVHNLTYFVN